jgi:hypothetical protein
MYGIHKSQLRCVTFILMAVLAFAFHGGTAYAQGVTPPVFFTPDQYQTAQARNQLEPGSLASCTVPSVTITHSPGYVVPTTPPQTLYVSLAASPHAACNDGTPAVFLFRPGFGAAASRWVIYLDGGGECHDQDSCLARQLEDPEYISSAPYLTGGKTLTPLAGILSPDPAQNPDFYDANLVQLDYCSSDDWMGEQTGNTALKPSQIRASDNVSNWYFDGHGIVQGVIALLQQSYGLNNATDVLLAGGSAGAEGVFMNANFVSGLLPLQTRFAALPDSGYSLSAYPDYDPATGGDAPLPTNEQAGEMKGQSLWASIGDFDCASASNGAGNGYNNLACDYPDVLSQNATYQIPLFIRSSYQDETILSTYNVTEPITAAEAPYVINFDNAMAQSLASTNLWLSVFGLNNTTHTMIKNSAFTDQSFTFADNKPSTLAAAVGTWYRNPCAAPRWMQKPTPE